jgi:eukaryotic-like serine/threonine-protein kinase
MGEELPALKARYDVRLVRTIAVGGMGSVYEGVLSGVNGFEKTVAIKTILETFSSHSKFVEMFIGEAKLVADLVHQNICQVYYLGQAGRRYYIAMEYISGVNLKEFIDRHLQLGQRVPPELAAFIISRVCRGLEYAHRKRDKRGRLLGVVHRDVSTKNIMISTEGEVKLTDFGVAKARDLMADAEGQVRVGKLPYMSPEQARYESTDGRSDLFSLGTVAFELLTGSRLFDSRSARRTVELVLTKVVPPLRELAEVSPGLERIVQKALERDLERRYQDAGEMAYDLEFEIYHRGYGPTIVALEKHMRKLFPALFRAGTERHQAVPRMDDRVFSVCSTLAADDLTLPAVSDGTGATQQAGGPRRGKSKRS